MSLDVIHCNSRSLDTIYGDSQRFSVIQCHQMQFLANSSRLNTVPYNSWRFTAQLWWFNAILYDSLRFTVQRPRDCVELLWIASNDIELLWIAWNCVVNRCESLGIVLNCSELRWIAFNNIELTMNWPWITANCVESLYWDCVGSPRALIDNLFNNYASNPRGVISHFRPKPESLPSKKRWVVVCRHFDFVDSWRDLIRWMSSS